MRSEYNFSDAKRNPYASKLKQPVTIRLDESTVHYFKRLAEELELPYQSLINLYLRDCAATGRMLAMNWTSVKSKVVKPKVVESKAMKRQPPKPKRASKRAA